MTPELYAFFKSYRAWLDAGAPQEKPFSRRAGLCYSLEYFPESTGSDRILLESMLQKRFGDACYPFGGEDVFGEELRNATAYLNPARIAFVDQMIAEYEAAEVV